MTKLGFIRIWLITLPRSRRCRNARRAIAHYRRLPPVRSGWRREMSASRIAEVKSKQSANGWKTTPAFCTLLMNLWLIVILPWMAFFKTSHDVCWAARTWNCTYSHSQDAKWNKPLEFCHWQPISVEGSARARVYKAPTSLSKWLIGISEIRRIWVSTT